MWQILPHSRSREKYIEKYRAMGDRQNSVVSFQFYSINPTRQIAAPALRLNRGAAIAVDFDH